MTKPNHLIFLSHRHKRSESDSVTTYTVSVLPIDRLCLPLAAPAITPTHGEKVRRKWGSAGGPLYWIPVPLSKVKEQVGTRQGSRLERTQPRRGQVRSRPTHDWRQLKMCRRPERVKTGSPLHFKSSVLGPLGTTISVYPASTLTVSVYKPNALPLPRGPMNRGIDGCFLRR